MTRALCIAALLLSACSGTPAPAPDTKVDEAVAAKPTEPPAPDVPEVVKRAAEVAKAVAADPAHAADALSAQGITLDELDTMLFEIAADPALTAAYETARH